MYKLDKGTCKRQQMNNKYIVMLQCMCTHMCTHVCIHTYIYIYVDTHTHCRGLHDETIEFHVSFSST